MRELGSEIFRRYGPWALLAAAVISSCVWVLAHYVAAPGGQVSVLWGLIQYTKQGAETPHQAPRGKEPPSGPPSLASSPVSSPPETTAPEPVAAPGHGLVVAHGLTVESAAKLIASVRRARGLRELGALESDKPLRTCPQGTVSYAHAVALTSLPPDGVRLDRISIERFPKSRSYFEIHCLADGNIFILGYTTEAASAQLPTSRGQSDISLVLSPRVWGAMTTLISLPIDRVRSFARREIDISEDQSQQVLDTVVR